jgi:hypothetical protein
MFFVDMLRGDIHGNASMPGQAMPHELTAGSKGGAGRNKKSTELDKQRNKPILAQIHCEAM